jgi:hypothetical protein
MARPPRQQKLTLSLLKEGMTRGDALRDSAAVTPHVVPALASKASSLFLASTAPHPPPWQSFLEDHVKGNLTGLYAASASGVLLLEASKRLFAGTSQAWLSRQARCRSALAGSPTTRVESGPKSGDQRTSSEETLRSNN